MASSDDAADAAADATNDNEIKASEAEQTNEQTNTADVAKTIAADNMYNNPVKDKKKTQHGPGMDPFPEAARLANQHFAIVALFPPGSKQTGRRVPICIRGVTATLEDAEEYIRDHLYPVDPDFTHVIVPMYEWGRYPPSQQESNRMDTTYHDPVMQQLMAGHFKTVAQDKVKLAARKRFAKQASRNKRNPANKTERATRRREARHLRAKALWTPGDKSESSSGSDDGKEEEVTANVQLL